jgi:hypothetical protein
MERGRERLWGYIRSVIREWVLFSGVVNYFSVRGSSSGQSISCYQLSMV